MNLSQIALVRTSFEKVQPQSDEVAALFYNRLFETTPAVKPLFKSNMQEQRRKLMQMLEVAVNGLERLEAITPAVQDLGKRHIAYGTLVEHYDSVGAALLWTLEQSLGADFTLEVKQAWSDVYTLLATVMKDAAVKV